MKLPDTVKFLKRTQVELEGLGGEEPEDGWIELQDQIEMLYDVMDKQMAEKIMRLEPEELELMLKGIIDQQMINEAKKRLIALKRILGADIEKHGDRYVNRQSGKWAERGRQGYQFASYLARA